MKICSIFIFTVSRVEKQKILAVLEQDPLEQDRRRAPLGDQFPGTALSAGEAGILLSWLCPCKCNTQGEEIIIAKANRPLVRLTPLEPPKKGRKAGLHEGIYWTSDDFDEPLLFEL